VTVGLCWLFVPLFVFFEGSSLYQWLLAVSGFSGAICWISIAWCQIRFRKQLRAEGRNSTDLGYAAPGYPVLSYLSVWVQIACLAFVFFDEDLRSCLYLGIPCVLLPMLGVYLWDKMQAQQKDTADEFNSSKSA
jgi:AAT family amino acid transporter